MDCMTVSLYRNLEKLAVRQIFKQEPTKKQNEVSDEQIGDSVELMTIPTPETCEKIDYKA